MIEREERVAPSSAGGDVRGSRGEHDAAPDRDDGRVEEREIDRVLPAMRGLRSRARVTNLARAAQLEEAIAHTANGGLDEAQRAQAVAVAHQLIGSAGTFGFADASRRAAELKDFFGLSQVDGHELETARERLSALREDLQSDGDVEF